MDDNSEQQQSPQGPKVDRTFIEGAAGEGVARPETGAAAPPGRNGEGLLPPGDKPVPLGSGTVAGILGTGGMARIYKIWNEKLEVYRAVKVLLPSQRPELRDRFETEAKITAKLDHPNIVDILTVGEWNGLPYIEMEYIDGCSLDELIARRGRLPPAVCSAVGCCIARALRYAHGLEYLLYGKTYRGMIHRDLKPANIMISREGAVKLMDFGIARPEGASLHTVEGNVVGTLQYLSPEQMDGVEIDSRSDIYSFGAILYEMVTGTRTFPQQTITNLMKVKALNRYRSFKELGCQVAPSLAKISQRCLQSERSRRYESAGSLLADLEAAHARLGDRGPEETVRAYCSSPSSPEAQPASKRIALPLWVWPVSAATLACIGAGLWLWLTPAGTPGEEPAVSPPPVESPREAVADTAAAEQEEETEEEQGPPAVREKESPPPRRAAAPEPKRRPARTKPVRRPIP